MTHVELGSGRTRQKLRTKNALIAAARAIVARGGTPTIEEAAIEAGISRTTAYRYFASQAEILAAAHPEIDRASLLPADASSNAEERVDIVVGELTKVVRASEPQQRTMLRLSLEPGVDRGALVLRQGRAIRWLEEALEPLDGLSRAEKKRLAIAIRSSTGIEAYVWLVDVGGLSPAEAIKTMRWSARAMVRTAIADSK